MPLESTSFGPPRPWWRPFVRLLLVLAAVGTILLGGWLGDVLSERQGMAALRQESNHRLDLFAAVVEGRIRRLEHVPATVQLSADVLALLREPAAPRRVADANGYLRRLNAHLGSLAVFVLDERGTVLASSNTDQNDDSLVGSDMAYRPYFLEALAGRVGRHFAIGARRGEPGYFVSHPIRDGARVVGVAAIKISLSPIEQIWEMLGAPALLADANQVVILSSQAEWRYTALAELPLERRVDLQINRLYDDLRIARFPLPVQLSVDEESQVVEGVLPAGNAVLARGSAEMLVLGRALDGMDWRVLIFSDLRGVRMQAMRYGILCGVAVAFVQLLLLYLLQRRRLLRQKLEAKQMLERVNTELEHKVAKRTRALSETNTRLRKEVAEREQAEQTLRAAQDELVHAGKMAVLGQLATGITHELTQPLGAIRTLSGNAREFLRRGDLDAVGGNLDIVARLADQMGGIIHPLKSFGRKSAAQPAATDVAVAVRNALFLYDQRLRKQGVVLDNRCTPEAGLPRVWCDPNRLEQVLVNLVGNAVDAMHGAIAPSLRIEARASESELLLQVIDSGPGFDANTRDHLFEPFFTTKPAGAGLGLGLAISRDIVRECGGEIEAHSPADAQLPEAGGARFVIRLPLASSAASSADPSNHLSNNPSNPVEDTAP